MTYRSCRHRWRAKRKTSDWTDSGLVDEQRTAVGRRAASESWALRSEQRINSIWGAVHAQTFIDTPRGVPAIALRFGKAEIPRQQFPRSRCHEDVANMSRENLACRTSICYKDASDLSATSRAFRTHGIWCNTTQYCVSKKWHWCSILKLQCTSTDFHNFWQRHCWESILANGDLFFHLS